MANFEGILNSAIDAENPEKGSLEIVLCGYGSQFPRSTDGTLARVMQEIATDTEGAYDFTLYGNDVITPAGTYYTFAAKDSNGDITQVNAYVVGDSGTYDLKDMVPFDPALPPPSLPPPIISQILIIPPGPSPDFDGSQYTTWKITLNQDVEAGFLAGIVPGNLYTFIIEQDSVGGHQFWFPTGPLPYGIQNETEICMEPNSVTIQTFVADETGVLWAIGPGTWRIP